MPVWQLSVSMSLNWIFLPHLTKVGSILYRLLYKWHHCIRSLQTSWWPSTTKSSLLFLLFFFLIFLEVIWIHFQLSFLLILNGLIQGLAPIIFWSSVFCDLRIWLLDCAYWVGVLVGFELFTGSKMLITIIISIKLKLGLIINLWFKNNFFVVWSKSLMVSFFLPGRVLCRKWDLFGI